VRERVCVKAGTTLFSLYTGPKGRDTNTFKIRSRNILYFVCLFLSKYSEAFQPPHSTPRIEKEKKIKQNCFKLVKGAEISSGKLPTSA
jgi:hypothetical protein